jgi:hypothetical protein
MKTLTSREAVDWVNATGLTANAVPNVLPHVLLPNVALPDDSGFVFTVRWPKILPYQVPFFATLFLPGFDEEAGNCLFWLRDNGASGVAEFEVACRTLEMLRAAHGENRAILESPAYLLEPADAVDARLLLTMSVLFCWDAYVVPRHGRYFVWIDDDEAADVHCRNREDYEKLLARFRDWGLVPEVAQNDQATC